MRGGGVSKGEPYNVKVLSKVNVHTCYDVLRVSGEGAVPHPASGGLSGIVALDAQLRHQGEVGRSPDLTGLICRAGGQQSAHIKGGA